MARCEILTSSGPRAKIHHQHHYLSECNSRWYTSYIKAGKNIDCVGHPYFSRKTHMTSFAVNLAQGRPVCRTGSLHTSARLSQRSTPQPCFCKQRRLHRRNGGHRVVRAIGPGTNLVASVSLSVSIVSTNLSSTGTDVTVLLAQIRPQYRHRQDCLRS